MMFSLKIVKTEWNILHAESKYGINNEGNREYIQHYIVWAPDSVIE
jgi:hypothetical protein